MPLNGKELTFEEKQQLALLTAKISLELEHLSLPPDNQSLEKEPPPYDPTTPEGVRQLAVDLADNYCEAMKVLDGRYAHWYY